MDIEDFKSGAPRLTTLKLVNGDSTVEVSKIHSGTQKLEKAICDDGDLLLGGCIASQYEAVIEGATDFTGYNIEVEQTINGNSYTIFTGKVASCELQKDRASRKIVAYDAFYELSKLDISDWYEGLTFPITIRNLFAQLLAYLGLEVVSLGSQFITYNLPVQKATSGYMSATTLLKAMCEYIGCFGTIEYEGKFSLIKLYGGNAMTALSGFKLPEYTVKAVDKVQVRSDANDVGGVAGTGNNAYICEGNFLAFNNDTAMLSNIATGILEKLANKSWRPCSFELPISYPVALGGLSVVTTPQGDNITALVCSYTMSGPQLMNMTVNSYGNEYRSEVTNDFNKQINVLKNKTLSVIAEVDQLQVKMTEKADKATLITEINQSSEAVQISANRVDVEIGARNYLKGSRTLLDYTMAEYLIDEAGNRLTDSVQLYT